jgi:hypothetical protein
MSFFESVLAKLKEVFSEVATFCEPFLKQFATDIGPVVLSAAEQAVTALAAQEMPGAQKQSAAFSQITTNLEQQGITVAASVINSAIEAAVANLKASAQEPAAGAAGSAAGAATPA